MSEQMTELQMSASKYFKSTGRVSTRSNAQPDSNDNGKPPPRLDSLFAEIIKVNATLHAVATDVSTIYPSNFRPISLLNLDCKILTKVLALCLQQVLPNIIHPNQTGFMKNRFSTDGMRKLLHLMWLSQSKDVPIAAISLDAEKAFDRVEWGFLFSTLTHLGFGPCFSRWVKILYKEPEAAVITNGIILFLASPEGPVRAVL